MAKLEEMELVDNLEMAAAAAPQRRLTAEEIDQASACEPCGGSSMPVYFKGPGTVARTGEGALHS
jgi:hypothetical protein